MTDNTLRASIAAREQMLRQIRVHEETLLREVARGRFDYATAGAILYLAESIKREAVV